MNWFNEVLKVRQVITDKHGVERPAETINGTLDCPICNEGEVIYSISSHNGHISGQCDTANCVNWME